MKKIDSHLHVAKVIAGYCRRGELRAAGNGMAVWGNGEKFRLLPEGYGDTEFTVESALAVMDRNEVSKAVLMQGSMYGFQNQYHYEIKEKYPDRFCPACTVDPFMTDCLSTLSFLLKERGFGLVKFEVSSGGGLMGCHEPFALDSERMMRLYELIDSQNAVAALDIGDRTMESYQPEALARIAKAFPKMRMVLCHLLAPGKGEEELLFKDLLMVNQDNVWFDISSVPKIYAPGTYPYPQVNRLLRRAAGLLGTGKLLWGTDAPFAATADSYEHLAGYLLEGDWTEGELKAIYYENADRVYFSRKEGGE